MLLDSSRFTFAVSRYTRLSKHQSVLQEEISKWKPESNVGKAVKIGSQAQLNNRLPKLLLGSMAASAILKLSGKDDWALFVGQWAAPFLIVGNYNKMGSRMVPTP